MNCNCSVFEASERGCLFHLKRHIDNGVPLNVADDDDVEHLTPLHIACLCGQLECVKLLLANGAPLDVKDFFGNTPLYAAIDNGDNLDCIKLLLNHGADIHDKNNIGDTALHIACLFKNRAYIALLIHHGADMNITNHRGETPIALAGDDLTDFIRKTYEEYESLHVKDPGRE
jgi:ankyrin repeat protein